MSIVNGFEIILDAEQFNYAYYQSHGAGFKISFSDFYVKPMLELSYHLIQTGSETFMNLKPLISYTTNDAIEKFKVVYVK